MPNCLIVINKRNHMKHEELFLVAHYFKIPKPVYYMVGKTRETNQQLFGSSPK